MPMPTMWIDANGQSVPALARYDEDGVVAAISSDTPVSLAIPVGASIIEIQASINVHIDLDGTASTSSPLFLAGAAVYRTRSGQTTISARRVGTDTGLISVVPLG